MPVPFVGELGSVSTYRFTYHMDNLVIALSLVRSYSVHTYIQYQIPDVRTGQALGYVTYTISCIHGMLLVIY